MAQVIPLRPHTFRLDNCVIDDYAAEMGAIGVALYAVLQRYADRTTGQCSVQPHKCFETVIA